MHWHRRLSAGARSFLCIVAVAAFLALGAPPVFRSLAGSSIHFAGPFHSTDYFLWFATGSNKRSQRLVALFNSLPSSTKILIVVPDDDQRSAFLRALVSYLAWPHPVEIFDLRKGRNRGSADSEKIGAVAFCRVQPPASWPRGERFGESLEIVSVVGRQ